MKYVGGTNCQLKIQDQTRGKKAALFAFIMGLSALALTSGCLPSESQTDPTSSGTSSSPSPSPSSSSANTPSFQGASSATNLDDTRVIISWTPDSLASSYSVYTMSGTGALSFIGSAPKGSSSYTAIGLTACTFYTFVVRANYPVTVGVTDSNLAGATALTFKGMATITPTSTTSASATWPACANAISFSLRCNGTQYGTAASGSTSGNFTNFPASTTQTCTVQAISPAGIADGNTNSQATCVAQQSGLVGWWDGDAVSGTTATDLMGASNGTSTSTIVTTPGVVSNAFVASGYQSAIRAPSTSSFNFTSAMTVAGWVNATSKFQGIPQVVASKGDQGTPTMGTTITSTAVTLGIQITQPYSFYDGNRYLYYYGAGGVGGGTIYRYDTAASFTAAGSYTSFNTSNVFSPSAATIYYGSGASDGRYFYLPIWQGSGGVGNVGDTIMRVDMTLDPTNLANWSYIDVSTFNAAWGSYRAAVFDGRYMYFFAQFGGGSANILRYDTTQSFTSNAANQYTAVTVGTNGMGDPVFDGRYIYFNIQTAAPSNTWTFYRYDTQQAFTFANLQTVTEGTITNNAFDGSYSQPVYDGRYVYWTPYYNGNSNKNWNHVFLRYDTTGTFTSAAAWSRYDLANVDATNSRGYTNAIFDGRYIYMSGGDEDHGVTASYTNPTITIYDTQGSFTSASSYQVLTQTQTLAGTQGWGGLAYDGRYVYAFTSSSYYSIDRIDTRPSGNMTFRLAAVHGGVGVPAYYAPGSTSAGVAMAGPSFRIATSNGDFLAYSTTPLSSGWHHLAGTYDGTNVKLYVDGALVATTAATGTLVSTTAPITVGGYGNNDAANFNGGIDELQVYNTALTSTQITNMYNASYWGVCKH